MSEDKMLKELLDSWNSGDKESTLTILNNDPDLIHKFKLIEKEEQTNFVQDHMDWIIALVISVFISPILVHLTDFLYVQFDSVISGVVMCLIILCSFPLIASIISFWYRSIKLPVYTYIGFAIIGSLYHSYFFSEGTFFFLLGESIGKIIVLLLFGLFVMLICLGITKKLIGIPYVEKPHQVSLRLPQVGVNFLKKIFLDYFDTHRMYGDFEYDTLRRRHYGKFKLIGDGSEKDVCAVEIIDENDHLITKIMFYSIDGTITRILNTKHSKKLSDELVTLIQARLKEIHYAEDANFIDLMDYALGYTRNRFQEKANQLLVEIKIKRTILLLGGIASIAIVSYLFIPEYGNQIIGIATIIGVFVTAYQVLIGRDKRKAN